MRKAAKTAGEVALVLAVLVLIYGGVHGWVMDTIFDRMHDESCYFCNSYRLTHLEDAAFQVREARRAAK